MRKVFFPRTLVIAIGFLALLSYSSTLYADETLLQQPSPESAERLEFSFDRQLEAETPPEIPIREFLQSSELKLNLRNYYLTRSRPENTDPRAWAQGNSVEYKVGRVGGYFSLASEFFYSAPLDAPEDGDGTLLLEPGQNTINVLGVVNPKFYFADQTISLYRQKFDLPFLNQQDNRMIPNTFEGYVLGMTKNENEQFQYITGYVHAMKKRESDSFTSMSDAAGVTGEEQGLLMAGARYHFTPDITLSAIDHYVEDIFNVPYAEFVYKEKCSEDSANSLSLQFGGQQGVGDHLLLEDDYSSYMWGVLDAFSYKHAILKAAFNMTDTGATVRSPYGSYPGYTSSIVEDFNRAGEKSWLVGLGYDFGRFDLKELSFNTAYIHGFDAIDEVTKADVNNKDETDLTIDYKFEDGPLSGLWIRLRGAFIHEEALGNTEDYRVIVNYPLSLYKRRTESEKTGT